KNKTNKLIILSLHDALPIYINMGCPQRNVIKNGACAALIKNRTLAKEIILAVIKGAEGLPVSVKTRIGINTIETEDWIGYLLKRSEEHTSELQSHLNLVCCL